MTQIRRKSPLLFDDEQMRQFIVNGYVVFQPDVPHEVNDTIYEKLQYVFDEEFNPGNNILPRIPEMYHILNSSEVQGALISVLGDGFIEHPHRHCHYIPPRPTEAQRLHQDSYTPLGRPRQHYPRFVRIMYYPQDTPVELGPTCVIPGSQYNKAVTDEDKERAIPMEGKAGTVSIQHFDVIHGAGVSQVNSPRHMIKFIYMRGQEPAAPSWNCNEMLWRTPNHPNVPYHLDLVWSHIWDWMCGKSNRYESSIIGKASENSEFKIANLSANQDLPTRLEAIQEVALLGDQATEAVPALIGMLNKDHQAVRMAAIYALGAIGSDTVEPMIQILKGSGSRENRELGPQEFTGITRPFWNESAIAMDDAAHGLGAVGIAAVRGLIDLLSHPKEWVRANAAFALGEMDSKAADAIPDLTRCLEDVSDCVVRTATDSLGYIREDIPRFLPSLGRLLKKGRPKWNKIEESLMSSAPGAGPPTRGWTSSDQLRCNAASTLARLGKAAADVEEDLIEALADPCGQVATFALDALRQVGSPTATEAVVEFLLSRRWDESIVKGRGF